MDINVRCDSNLPSKLLAGALRRRARRRAPSTYMSTVCIESWRPALPAVPSPPPTPFPRISNPLPSSPCTQPSRPSNERTVIDSLCSRRPRRTRLPLPVEVPTPCPAPTRRIERWRTCRRNVSPSDERRIEEVVPHSPPFSFRRSASCVEVRRAGDGDGVLRWRWSVERVWRSW